MAIRADVSPAEVLAHSFEPDEAWPGTGTPALTECVTAILHAIEPESSNYSDNLMICSLIAITVWMADTRNDNFRIALLLRNCARILEIEARHR